VAAKGNWQNDKKRNGFFYQRERRYYYDAFIHVSAAMYILRLSLFHLRIPA